MDVLFETLLSYGSVSVWIIVFIVSLILEGISAGLVSLWFAGGALFALILAAVKAPLWLQIVSFLIVSLLLLLSARPLMAQWLSKNQSTTNLDSVIGKEAKVTEEINNIEQTGAVKIQGKEWTARNVDNRAEPVPVGSIESIQGVKLLIEYKNNEKE